MLLKFMLIVAAIPATFAQICPIDIPSLKPLPPLGSTDVKRACACDSMGMNCAWIRANAIFGGWKVNLSENALSGIPVSVTYAGSPNRSLTNYLINVTRVNAVTTLDQAKVQNYDIENRFPVSQGQNRYFNISSFAYPDAYTIGSLGARVLDAPAILWMQFFVTKSWMPKGERLKLSLRLDGHNLPWKRPQLSAPNTTYNL